MVQMASTLRCLSIPDWAWKQNIKVDQPRSTYGYWLPPGFPGAGESGDVVQEVLLDLLLVLRHHGGGEPQEREI